MVSQRKHPRAPHGFTPHDGDALIDRTAAHAYKTGGLSRRNFLQLAGLVGGGHILATQLGPIREAMAAVLGQSNSVVGPTDGILVFV